MDFKSTLLIFLVTICSIVNSSVQSTKFRTRNGSVDKQNGSTTLDEYEDDFLPFDGQRYDSFDWALSKKLAELNSGQNMIVSPISVKILLSLLFEGAAGNTSKELSEVLELPFERKASRERMQKVINSFQAKHPDYELLMSTRLFLDGHYTPRQRFTAILENFYMTQIQKIDFRTHPSSATKLINDWITEATKGRVESIVTDDDIKNSVLILMNAIFFKGKWRYAFHPNDTHTGNFHINSKQKVPATYMTNTASYYFIESAELDAKVIRLPYQGHKFAMYMFLPNSKNGLPDLLKRLTPNLFHKQLWLMDEVKVKVVIPKLKYESTAQLGPILEQLGLVEIFQNTASLPGIARGQNGGQPNLIVSDAFQKSGIDIYEEGSEAFSATSITLGNKFNSADHIFNASHPFLFLIEDEQTGAILYFGKVENPTSKTGEIKVPWPAVPPPSAASFNQPQSASDVSTPFLNSPDVASNLQNTQRANYFDVEILQAMARNKPGNVLVSPLSVKTVLAMILEGSAGNTARELQSALRFPESAEATRLYMQSLVSGLNNVKTAGVEINVANGIFHASSIPLYPTYKQLIKNYYQSELQPVNFADKVNCAQTINNWVKQMTSKKIEQIVKPEQLNPATVMVLVNAIFFKGKWLHSFSKRDTVERAFYVTEDENLFVETMHITDTYRFAEIPELDSKVVDLPYQGEKYGMLLIVPNKKNGMNQLLRDLPHKPLPDIYQSLYETEVEISLPKFKVEFEQDITSDLQSMGIHQVFTPEAELTGIAPNEKGLHVDSVHHKVVMEVNEEGSIAAASTGSMLIPLIGSTNPQIRADHPFLLFIHDIAQGNVLFAGKIARPK
ncbi:uncharacterized protein LOC123302606 [Chrysoperla carnea]|uniref:uncharacterized protein LOC123302606 n=1 Tax=Chrysoperla carnea TaxID=189513 RepID=UPI001D06F28E|nr:uncharacterized protein LOC123302606 [Chrysoperla carnea]